MLKILGFKITTVEIQRLHKISGSLYEISNKLWNPQLQLSSKIMHLSKFCPTYPHVGNTKGFDVIERWFPLRRAEVLVSSQISDSDKLNLAD